MTAPNDAQEPRPADAAPLAADSVAARLREAVRAVESGERSADSFFTRPQPPPRPRSAPGAAPGGAAPVGDPVPVPVPAGLPSLLAAGGAPEALAGRVAAALGEGAERELGDDPWRLLAVEGVRPEQADGFARSLLGPDLAPGDERRTRALTGWLLERAALAGHTALPMAVVAERLAGHSVPDPEAAIRDAVEAGAVLVFQDREDVPAAGAGEDEKAPVRVLLGLDRCALAEESLADGLARLHGTFAGPGTADWAASAATAPSASAGELIRAVADAALVAHTGGEAARAEPAALVAAALGLGLRVCAASHTPDGRGRLAALLSEGAGAAVTVAGLLAGAEGPERDPEGTLPLDLLVVLDAGQLTAESAASLVESLPDGARLVLSGDPALLGPAGPGRVLADVLAAGGCPHVRSRTPDPGPVGELVSGVGVGELPQVAAPGNEVVIVPVRDPGEAVHRTVQLVTDSIPRAFGLAVGEAQVITPGHGGPAGTRSLNAALKERLNPGPGRFDGFDPGDRVAHSPAPGRLRLATVVEADAAGLWLEGQGGRFLVPRHHLADTLRHGWAVTAHQAAGTRWPAVVVVLPADAAGALDRAWVYTAFGRGTAHLSVVQGVGPALAGAVAAPAPAPPTTRLRALLREQAAQVPAG